MFPNVRMSYKLIILFAFFATISCTTFLDEILKIYVEKCKGKNADLEPLELTKCGEIPFAMNNDTSVEKERCVVAKNIISDICNGTNENVKFTDGITGMKEFTNANNFCEKSSRIEVNDKVLPSLAYFMNISSNNRKCESFCTDLTDRTIPICSFFAALSYHKLSSEVPPPVIVNSVKTNLQPPKSVTLPPVNIPNRKLNPTSDKYPAPNQPINKNSNLDKTVDKLSLIEIKNVAPEPPANEDSNSDKFEDKPLLSETKKDAPNQANNENSNSHKIDHKPPMTERKEEDPNYKKNGNVVLNNKNSVTPTLSSSFNDPGETDGEAQENDYTDNDQTPKKTDVVNQPITIDVELPEKVQDPSNDPFVKSDDSNFFYYFILISALCIFFYVGMYNKKKILALVIEGRRSNVKRRPNSAAYSKLDCNLEEAMTSGPSTSSSNTLLY